MSSSTCLTFVLLQTTENSLFWELKWCLHEWKQLQSLRFHKLIPLKIYNLSLSQVLLPDKAFESSRLRVNAERHSTPLLLFQNELMDDLCGARRQTSAQWTKTRTKIKANTITTLVVPPGFGIKDKLFVIFKHVFSTFLLFFADWNNCSVDFKHKKPKSIKSITKVINM